MDLQQQQQSFHQPPTFHIHPTNHHATVSTIDETHVQQQQHKQQRSLWWTRLHLAKMKKIAKKQGPTPFANLLIDVYQKVCQAPTTSTRTTTTKKMDATAAINATMSTDEEGEEGDDDSSNDNNNNNENTVPCSLLQDAKVCE
jgi:hypothetical protein